MPQSDDRQPWIIPFPQQQQPKVSEESRRWLFFSTMERAIVQALEKHGDWMIAARIATRIGAEGVTHEMRAILRNLTDRGVLRMSQRHGYRLVQASEIPEERQ